MGGMSPRDALNAALNADQTAFDVVLASTGQTIQVSMGLETVVVTTNNALGVSAGAVLPVSTGVVTVTGAVTVTQADDPLPVSTGVVPVTGAVTVTGTADPTASVSTLLDPYDTVAGGWETAAAASTAYQCTSQACVTVAFKAHPDNSGNIWVGDSNVSGASSGFPLDAGESISIRISNVNKAYYWADTADDKLCWITIA